MDDLLILGSNDVRTLFNRFLAQYDVPAYVRRGQRVEEAFDQLMARCQQERTNWLKVVRNRLSALRCRAGSWAMLQRSLVNEEQARILADLESILQPEANTQLRPSNSTRTLWRAFQELVASIERFNRRWEDFLQGLDITRLNELREGYNRYYVLEKECVVRSPRVARQGFVPLGPVSVEQLRARFPLLPVPRIES